MNLAAGDSPFYRNRWVRIVLRIAAYVGVALGLVLGIGVLILHLTTDPLATLTGSQPTG